MSCQGENQYGLEMTNPYYLKLEKACKGSSCCRASVKIMLDSNATLVPKNSTCNKGFHREMLRCIDTYQWCAKGSRTK